MRALAFAALARLPSAVRGRAFVVVLVARLARGVRARRMKLNVKRATNDDDDGDDDDDDDDGRMTTSLSWRSVTMTMTTTKTNEKREILRDCTGTARAGRLLAIMGPSGSGKSSLLNALASRAPRTKGMTLRGRIEANGRDCRRGKGYRKAFVYQEDVFYSQLTTRETLEMAARLGGAKDVGATTETLLRELGLRACANTRVGDKKTRGISGGEKKRLALGVQLVGAPAVIFADEPTSGLDSFQAQRVMETLSRLAREHGKTVICSIHQPRSSIVDLFDDLCLLAGGRVAYFGPMASARDWFAAAGYAVPQNVNTAEYLIDLVSVDVTSPEAATFSAKRIEAIVERHASSPPPQFAAASTAAAKTSARAMSVAPIRVGFWKQFPLLLRRSWRQVKRDKATNIVRLMTSLNSAMVFGSIFWKMKLTQTAIQDRLGLLQVSAINAAMSALMKTLTSFTKEKVIINRERASRSYGVLPYFTGKLIAELPVGAFFPLAFGACVYPMTGLHPTWGAFGRFCAILTLESFTSSSMGLAISAVAPSTEAAVALGPAVMVLFIVFGGYYVNPENVPPYFRWLNKCSLIKWAFQGLAINEFRGLEFETSKPYHQRTGEQVLERLSFADASALSSLRAQGNILAFCYLLTLDLLERSEPKFIEMKD